MDLEALVTDELREEIAGYALEWFEVEASSRRPPHARVSVDAARRRLGRRARSPATGRSTRSSRRSTPPPASARSSASSRSAPSPRARTRSARSRSWSRSTASPAPARASRPTSSTRPRARTCARCRWRVARSQARRGDRAAGAGDAVGRGDGRSRATAYDSRCLAAERRDCSSRRPMPGPSGRTAYAHGRRLARALGSASAGRQALGSSAHGRSCRHLGIAPACVRSAGSRSHDPRSSIVKRHARTRCRRARRLPGRVRSELVGVGLECRSVVTLIDSDS